MQCLLYFLCEIIHFAFSFLEFLGCHARLGEDSADLRLSSLPVTRTTATVSYIPNITAITPVNSSLEPQARYPNGYIGCYQASGLAPIFEYVGTVEACESLCERQLASYAALSNANQCYCIDSYAQEVKSSEAFCDVPCVNNTGEICGGKPPYVSVYRTPNQGNAGSDPWYLARATEPGSFVANFTGSFIVPPIEMYYKVFHDKIPDVVITLFQYDCSTLLADSSLTTSTDPTYTGLDTNPPSSIVVPTDIAIYMVGIYVNGNILYSSPVWNPTTPSNPSSGNIDFCVRADLFLDPANKSTSVSFTKTKISLAATLSENFTVASLQATAVVDETTNQTASVDYQLSACHCDSSNICFVPDNPVVADSALRICVLPLSPAVTIAQVTSLELAQGGVPVRFPISNGVDDPLTSTTLNQDITLVPSSSAPLPGGAVIETRLTSEFFQSATPGNIQVSGSVLLQFTSGGRILVSIDIAASLIEGDSTTQDSSPRNLQSTSTAPTAGFSVDVPVEASIGSSSMSVGAVVGGIVVGVVVVALAVGFVVVRRVRANTGGETLEAMKENKDGDLEAETSSC